MGYSQAGQDQFVIDTLKGKNSGVYVEIGAYHSKDISNTYMLEKEYGWTGVSFEIDPDRANEFNANRSNKCYTADATTFDYETLFYMLDMPKQIDYLQVDIEPSAFKEGFVIPNLKPSNLTNLRSGIVSQTFISVKP
jgi:hypothetical protein